MFEPQFWALLDKTMRPSDLLRRVLRCYQLWCSLRGRTTLTSFTPQCRFADSHIKQRQELSSLLFVLLPWINTPRDLILQKGLGTTTGLHDTLPVDKFSFTVSTKICCGFIRGWARLVQQGLSRTVSLVPHLHISGVLVFILKNC